MSCGLRQRLNSDVMMGVTENYDPNSNVCDNQGDFNMAFRKAIEHNDKENMKKAKPWMYVYAVLWAVFLIWGIFLAMQVTPGHERIEHLVFAILFSPVYVLSYYLGALGQGGSTMGMRKHY